jgi:hypothetical protein
MVWVRDNGTVKRRVNVGQKRKGKKHRGPGNMPQPTIPKPRARMERVEPEPQPVPWPPGSRKSPRNPKYVTENIQAKISSFLADQTNTVLIVKERWDWENEWAMHYLMKQLSLPNNVQVAHLQGIQHLLTNRVMFKNLLAYICAGRLIALNLGELYFTHEDFQKLINALNNSKVCYIYTQGDAKERRDIKAAVKANRPKTNRYLFRDDDCEHNAMLQDVKDCFYNPSSLPENKATMAKLRLTAN